VSNKQISYISYFLSYFALR